MKKDISGEGAGNALTHWETPAWCTAGLLDHWPELRTWSRAGHPLLEPSAGSGGIVRALVVVGCEVEAMEIRPECEPLLEEAGACRITIDDFLQTDTGKRTWSALVMNPPYRPAWTMIRHMRRAFDVARLLVAALLPVSFLSGGSGRADFWREAPDLTQILFFSGRPAFDESGGMFEPAWFVWDLREGSKPRAARMIDEPTFQPKTFDW